MISLRTERPAYEEIKTIVHWLNDKALMKYSEQRHIKHTVESQNQYIKEMDDAGNLYLKIIKDGILIGTVSAVIDLKNSVADLGILIGAEYVGRGYGASAWRRLCEKLNEFGIRKLEAGCMSRNRAMIRIFEKNGMRLEGMRNYHFKLGQDKYDHMVMYGMLT